MRGRKSISWHCKFRSARWCIISKLDPQRVRFAVRLVYWPGNTMLVVPLWVHYACRATRQTPILDSARKGTQE